MGAKICLPTPLRPRNITAVCSAFALLSVSGMSHVAWGQTEDEQEVPQYTAEKEPEVSPVVSFSRYIGLQGITHNLANRGIYFNGYYAGTSYSQASGGRKKGTAFLHDFAYGMDLDLEKLVHLHGGQIHIGLDSRFGTFNAGGLIPTVDCYNP